MQFFICLKRHVAILLCILFLFQNNFSYVQAEEVKETELYARAAVLMDADNGRVLYEKNGDEIMPMASTTKIMTCIIALENGNMEDTVTASSYAASQPKVRLGMVSGRKYRMEDLLYSLMLESHNDSAVAIAEYIGGTVPGFAELMNQKARDLGCTDTYFITPNGLDAQVVTQSGEVKQHSTTAKDLARIMKYCIEESPKKEEFLAITRTVSHSFKDVEGKSSYSCNNHNAFLSMMEGALSGKTGFTSKAGYCYVGALKKDGKTFVVALLACGWPNNKTYKWSDTKRLMKYGLGEYQYREFVLPDTIKSLDSIPVRNGQTDMIGGAASAAISVKTEPYGMLMKEDESVTLQYEWAPYLIAPVKQGTVIGQVRYLVDGQIIKMDTIVTAESIDKIDYRWCLKQVIDLFLKLTNTA